MGTSPSKTRRLTVENDDPTSVIKVSEDVVDRIRGVAQSKCLTSIHVLGLFSHEFSLKSSNSLLKICCLTYTNSSRG